MNIKNIQVVILNHKPEAVEKFSRNASAIRYYQEDENIQLINDLYQRWFGINEACIVAHHCAALTDNGEEVNYVVAVNSFQASATYELSKIKGKRIRYVFILFNTEEVKAREYVYLNLRELLLQNKTQPVQVEVDYHNVSFY